MDGVRFHASSVLDAPPCLTPGQGRNTRPGAGLPSEWLLYDEMTRLRSVAAVRGCTLLSPICVALFAGPAKLSTDLIQQACCAAPQPPAPEGGATHGEGEEASDSEAEDARTASFRTDDWIAFGPDPEVRAPHLPSTCRLSSLSFPLSGSAPVDAAAA